jgi:hypothetical protein
VLDAMFNVLTAFLSNEAAMSIVFGVVISLAGTQFLKFRVPVPRPLRDEYQWFVRLVSLPLGFFPTYFTWPFANRGWIALCVGLTGPVIYKVFVAVLYWKWPELEKRLSAAPKQPAGEQ